MRANAETLDAWGFTVPVMMLFHRRRDSRWRNPSYLIDTSSSCFSIFLSPSSLLASSISASSHGLFSPFWKYCWRAVYSLNLDWKTAYCRPRSCDAEISLQTRHRPDEGINSKTKRLQVKDHLLQFFLQNNWKKTLAVAISSTDNVLSSPLRLIFSLY